MFCPDEKIECGLVDGTNSAGGKRDIVCSSDVVSCHRRFCLLVRWFGLKRQFLENSFASRIWQICIFHQAINSEHLEFLNKRAPLNSIKWIFIIHLVLSWNPECFSLKRYVPFLEVHIQWQRSVYKLRAKHPWYHLAVEAAAYEEAYLCRIRVGWSQFRTLVASELKELAWNQRDNHDYRYALSLFPLLLFLHNWSYSQI